MSAKDTLKDLVRRGTGLITRHAQDELRDDRNVDLVLGAALRESGGLSAIRYPTAYVELLRRSLAASVHRVVQVKREKSATLPATASRRFAALVEQLGTGLPAIDFAVAREVGRIADRNRSRCEPVEFGEWSGDVGLHFAMSSSLGGKGRILFNVIRFMRSERCLEVGTAYGMSALFILAALRTFTNCGHLTTVEGAEPQFSLSAATLKEHCGEMVSSCFGSSRDVLPELVRSLGQLDFMFHDGGHSREDYVRDFSQVVDLLGPGAVVLFDDIRWEDPRFVEGQARTYEGWREVVAHPRVAQAVEIDDGLGFLLMQ